MDMDISDGECLIIYWKIKNFSYCYENIRSPNFYYSGDHWYLQINPTGVTCELCYLNHSAKYLEYNISFLTCDGSWEKTDSRQYSCPSEISKGILFGKRRSEFLPKDTLTVRCRIHSLNEKGTISIRSRIAVKRKCFIWNLNDISYEYQNNKLFVENSDQYGDIQLNLKSVGGVNSEAQYYIDISRSRGEKCHCVLKVSLLDIQGNVLKHISDEFDFEKGARDQIWRFPPIIKKRKLMAFKNDLLLPKSTVPLKCNFAVTQGKVEDQTVVFSYDSDVIPLLKHPDDLSICFDQGSSSTDLKKDFKSM